MNDLGVQDIPIKDLGYFQGCFFPNNKLIQKNFVQFLHF